MVQSCFTAWNWFQPSLVNLEAEESKPKVYSWDTKKVDLTQYSFENLQDQTVVKAPGSIDGQQFMVRNCINCNIYLLDHINTITIDDCKNCKIFIGPTKVKITQSLSFYYISKENTFIFKSIYKSNFLTFFCVKILIESNFGSGSKFWICRL